MQVYVIHHSPILSNKDTHTLSLSFQSSPKRKRESYEKCPKSLRPGSSFDVYQSFLCFLVQHFCSCLHCFSVLTYVWYLVTCSTLLVFSGCGASVV